MRKRSKNKDISVHAIAGTEVVLLGFNATPEAAEGLLGFTIFRRKGKTGKKLALGGGRVFAGVQEEIEPGKVRSDAAPIQAFMWSDYVVEPGTAYTYIVIPRYGAPGALEPAGKGVTVTVTTEDPGAAKHAVYFNRGVAGSRRYSQRFAEYRRWYLIDKPRRAEPSETDNEGTPAGTETSEETPRARPLIKPDKIPNGEAYAWLSRGLEEAILAFIAQAKGKGYALRAAVYEFTYAPVIQSFVDALERGVDVKIVHHAKRENLYRLKRNYNADTTTRYTVRHGSAEVPDPDTEPARYANREVRHEQLKDSVCRSAEAAVAQIGLANPDEQLLKAFNKMLIQRQYTQISHNKFIVLLKNGNPTQVWTGSTNFTAGGIFGQSNVGHVIRDAKLARKYLSYWKQLSRDPQKTRSAKQDPMRNWTVHNTPDLKKLPPKNSITPIFSPRTNTDILQWYADRLASAEHSAFFTAAFSVDKRFLNILTKRDVDHDEPYLRYVLLETRGGKMWNKYLAMARCPQNRIAWGDVLKPRDTEQIDYSQLLETLTGLNTHVEYLHTKYMLIDPLTDDPIVITGSANFSEASTTKNDENMVIIRGDKRVADIFLGEFMRLFNHFHWRNRANRMSKKQFAQAALLCPDDFWTKPYYTNGSQEQKQRLLFS